MCIIMSKPAGIEFPDIITLRNCWDNNPHGAGYAVAYREKVHIRKGFMTWEDFMESINFDQLVKYSCVFHFRYATHGSRSGGNCHPFPVSGNLKQEEIRTYVAIAHNGVIPNIQITEDDYSDTMSYVSETISPFWEYCKEKGARYMYSIKRNKENLLQETRSKWSFLFGDGKIINVGQGVRRDGIWYSNAGFQCSSYRLRRRPRKPGTQQAALESLVSNIKAVQFASAYFDTEYCDPERCNW